MVNKLYSEANISPACQSRKYMEGWRFSITGISFHSNPVILFFCRNPFFTFIAVCFAHRIQLARIGEFYLAIIEDNSPSPIDSVLPMYVHVASSPKLIHYLFRTRTSSIAERLTYCGQFRTFTQHSISLYYSYQ